MLNNCARCTKFYMWSIARNLHFATIALQIAYLHLLCVSTSEDGLHLAKTTHRKKNGWITCHPHIMTCSILAIDNSKASILPFTYSSVVFTLLMIAPSFNGFGGVEVLALVNVVDKCLRFHVCSCLILNSIQTKHDVAHLLSSG